MPVPKSVTKVYKNGHVEFTSHVDKAEYCIQELVRGALRDVGKYLRKAYAKRYTDETVHEITGLGKKQVGYWARKKECDLLVGLGNTKKPDKTKAHWAEFMEIGSTHRPKKAILTDTVFRSVDKIIEIEKQYLSALNDPEPNMSGLSERDYEG